MSRQFHDAPTGKYFDDEQIPAKIPFNPSAPIEDTLCFRHYNGSEKVLGKPMADWLRFSVVYWHTFRGTGADIFGPAPTISRAWEDGIDSMENAKRRVNVAFEFFKRLGVQFYTFHDRDVAPEGKTLAETNENLDEIVELLAELQSKTGIKLLWNTCNLFSHPRYMNGAATNPDAHVFAYAGAQVKKGLDIAKRLNAENFIFWGGREGFQTLLNTNIKREMDHMAAFFRMALDYRKKIGFTGQFCIEPKAKEPMAHQYDYDAATVIGFLRNYGLENDFKLNIEPNHTMLAGHAYLHDVCTANAFGMLGSVDANRGAPDCGWDTDQFPMEPKECMLLMKVVLDQGGLAPGGLNFDCKVRRESISIRDLFVAHIGAMDALALGLKRAAKMKQSGLVDNLVKERYSSYCSGFGGSVENGTATLEDCQKYIEQNGEPKQKSGNQENYEVIINRFLE